MGFFERYLSVWVMLCIAAGIALGHLMPQAFQSVGSLEMAQINLPVAILLWLMIVPMLLKIDLKALENQPDDIVRQNLKMIKGIGDWTANIYLLMALRRTDIWPEGDLALINAIIKLKKLQKLPKKETLQTITDKWKPWRAVAARMLWHFYLNEK